MREVKEETGLTVTEARYVFSLPNVYVYSGFEVKTLDSFFLCQVEDFSTLHASDDAAALQWIPITDIHTELFGLRSVRHGLYRFVESYKKP